jgi:hypothetical protein
LLLHSRVEFVDPSVVWGVEVAASGVIEVDDKTLAEPN